MVEANSLVDDIGRATLDFPKDPSDILCNDSHGDKLHTEEKQDKKNCRGPARYVLGQHAEYAEIGYPLQHNDASK